MHFRLIERSAIGKYFDQLLPLFQQFVVGQYLPPKCIHYSVVVTVIFMNKLNVSYEHAMLHLLHVYQTTVYSMSAVAESVAQIYLVC